MALLAGTLYDPASAATKATDTLIAMTAIDTTNLRVTFTAPASGKVWVRLRCPTYGATTFPAIFLGVLDGATVRLRMSPLGNVGSALATSQATQEVGGLVTGLTPGNSYTWDAAYGVDVVVASTNIKYGGPNDASGGDAWGGFVFEVWDTPTLLAGVTYDPAVAVSKGITSLIAMTAFDTTNLRLTFTAPASGKVMWRIRATYAGSSTPGQTLLGILESTTVVARVSPLFGACQTLLSTTRVGLEASGLITGISAGSHSYDAAFTVQTVSGASGALKYGGPDDTTTNNAWGGLAFELWSAA